MFIRPELSRQKLHTVALRLCDLITREMLTNANQIQAWRAIAHTEPVKSIREIAKFLDGLQVETIQNYSLDKLNGELKNE